MVCRRPPCEKVGPGQESGSTLVTLKRLCVLQPAITQLYKNDLVVLTGESLIGTNRQGQSGDGFGGKQCGPSGSSATLQSGDLPGALSPVETVVAESPGSDLSLNPRVSAFQTPHVCSLFSGAQHALHCFRYHSFHQEERSLL